MANLGTMYVDEDRFRHWSPESQSYAPVDVLENYLRTGWTMDSLAAVETFYYAGYRRVDVFYLTLRRGEACLEMPVLANPKLMRLIEENELTVLRVNASRGEVD